MLSPLHRRLALGVILFVLAQILWLLIARASYDTNGSSSSRYGKDAFSGPSQMFAYGLSQRPDTHVVCEIGHDSRLGSLWVGNPLISVFRFDDGTIPPPPIASSRIRAYRIAEAHEMIELRKYIFHCDLISITNATKLTIRQVADLIAELRQFSLPDTPVVTFGMCIGCSTSQPLTDHVDAQLNVWMALRDIEVLDIVSSDRYMLTKVIQQLVDETYCSTTIEYQGWCVGNLKWHRQIGSLRPSDIPHLDPFMISTLRQRAYNNTVFLTPISAGFKDIVKNYECSLRRVGINAILYQPVDNESVALVHSMNQEYSAKSINRFLLAHIDPVVLTTPKPALSNYKQEYFLKLMRWRFALQVELMMMGFNVIISDADISFKRNPMPYFSFAADVEAQPDMFDWEELSNVTWGNVQLNGGLYLALASDGGLAWMSMMKLAWIHGAKAKGDYDDQEALIDVATQHGCFTQFPNMYSNEEGCIASFRFLDPGNFPTGHLAQGDEKINKLKSVFSPKRPLVGFHANGATADKPHKMRSMEVWYGPDKVSDYKCDRQRSD